MKHSYYARFITAFLASPLLFVMTLFAGNSNPGYDDPSTGDECFKCEIEVPCPTVQSFHWRLECGVTNYGNEFGYQEIFRAGVRAGSNAGAPPLNFTEVHNRTFAGQARQPITLSIDAPVFSSALYNRGILKASSASGATIKYDIVTGGGTQIRQIVSLTHFTDVSDLSTNDGFLIRKWSLDSIPPLQSQTTSGGSFYIVPTTDPALEVTFKQPHPGGDPNDQLQITEVIREGNATSSTTRTTTTLYREKTLTVATTGSELRPDWIEVYKYEGATTAGDLIEKERLDYSNHGKIWAYTLERQLWQAHTINGVIQPLATTPAADTLVSHTQEVYEDFSLSAVGGESRASRMVSQTIGYNAEGGGLTTTWSFLTDTYTEGSVVKANPNHGRLVSKKYPDGRWEAYEYFDDLTSTFSTETKYSSWNDVTLANKANARKVVTEYTEDKVITNTYLDGELVAKNREAMTIDTDTVSLHRRRYAEGATYLSKDVFHKATFSGSDPIDYFRAGRIKYQEHLDGTVTRYEYSAGTNGEFIEVEETGAGDETSVTAGTRVTRTYSSSQTLLSEVIVDIASNLQTSSWLGLNFDFMGRPTRVEYNGNSNDYEEKVFSCCGLSSYRKRDGTMISYSRDALKRLYITETDLGGSTPIITEKTDYTGKTVSSVYIGPTVRRTRVAGTTTLLVGESTSYLNGRIYESIVPDADGVNVSAGEVTTYTYTNATTTAGEVVTMTRPDSSTVVTASYLDGRNKKVSGTAMPAVAYEHSVDSAASGTYKNRIQKSYRLATDSATTSDEWTEVHRDALGRTAKQVLPDPTGTSGATVATSYNYYVFTGIAQGSRGKLKSVTDLEGDVTTYEYSTKGDQIKRTRVMPNSSGDLVAETVRDVISDITLGTATSRTTNTVNNVTVGRSYRASDDFSRRTENVGVQTNLQITDRGTLGDGARTIRSTGSDGSYMNGSFANNRVSTQTLYDSNDIQVAKRSYFYDDFGRVIKISDARTGDKVYAFYLQSGNPLVMINAGKNTVYTYDSLGRVTIVDAPDTLDSSGNNLTNKTYTRYTTQGQVEATWGDQTYARFYDYDEQGRMVELRTYRNLAHGTEPLATTMGYASTQWVYDSARGWLLEKNYDGESEDGVTDADYAYNAAGRLITRTWERTIDNGSGTQIPLTTTYAYDKGYLASVTYNDTVTPDLGYTYDNFGRKTAVTQGAVTTHSYVYDSSTLLLDTETIAYDTNGDGDTIDTEDLVRVLDRSRDSDLRNTGWELKNGGAVDHFNTYTYDTASRLHTVDDSFTSHITGESFAFRYSYLANSGSLISNIERSGTSTANTWETQRDVLTDTTTSINGGGAVKSRHSYTVNDLGQRTVHTNHLLNLTQNIGYNARGEVVSSTTVSPTWPQLSNRTYSYDGIGNRQSHSEGTGGGLQTTSYTANALNQYTAVGSQSPVHDSDGNLTSGHLPTDTTTASSLEWDAENRLIKVTQGNNNVIEYSYDYRGRRIRQTQTGEDTAFIYDDWNMIHDYSLSSGVSPAALSRFTWGLDLSGSLQGAGGVGGLLSTRLSAGGTYTPICDGNGNVTEYLSTSGSICLQLGYDVFGNTIHEGGHLASTPSSKPATRFRFSSKAYDYDTGLYYYGYRYYDSKTGRWPSRDPIKEKGGMNLYAMVDNGSINQIDVLGLAELTCNTPGDSSNRVFHHVDTLFGPAKTGGVPHKDAVGFTKETLKQIERFKALRQGGGALQGIVKSGFARGLAGAGSKKAAGGGLGVGPAVGSALKKLDEIGNARANNLAYGVMVTIKHQCRECICKAKFWGGFSYEWSDPAIQNHSFVVDEDGDVNIVSKENNPIDALTPFITLKGHKEDPEFLGDIIEEEMLSLAAKCNGHT